jgi:DNA-binding PadR family transcriptional regulator
MSVKHQLLALLYNNPIHGYELGKKLNLALGTGIDISTTQVSSTLNRLEKSGWIDFTIQTVDDAPDRKVYHLTVEGIRVLEDWYLEPDIRDYHLSDTFYSKLVLSLIDAPISPEKLLNNQRRQLYQELHDVIEMRSETDENAELPLLLLLETVIVHLEADIRWIEMCEARLSDLKTFSPPNPKPQPRGRPAISETEEESS